jgi:hypothetical protein
MCIAILLVLLLLGFSYGHFAVGLIELLPISARAASPVWISWMERNHSRCGFCTCCSVSIESELIISSI